MQILLFGKTYVEKRNAKNKKLLEMKNGTQRFAFGFPVRLADGRWLFWGRYFAYYMVSQDDDGNYIPYYDRDGGVIRRCYLNRNNDHIIKIN